MNFTNFMEGVLLIVSTGFAPGSIYGSTLFVHGYFAVCAGLDPVSRYNHDPFGTRPVLKLSWRSIGLQRERLSSQVVMPQEGRCSILCLMSVIEGRLPAQSCVLFLEHSSPVRHTALCRDAARFALLQNLVWRA